MIVRMILSLLAGQVSCTIVGHISFVGHILSQASGVQKFQNGDALIECIYFDLRHFFREVSI